MKKTNQTKKILTLSTALVTLLGIAVPAMNANADSNYNQNSNEPIATSNSGMGHHRKMVEIQPGATKKVSRPSINHVNPQAINKKPSKKINNKKSSAVRKAAISYINHVRTSVGLNALKINPIAQKVANQRAEFSADHNTIAHRDAKGNHYANPLFNKLGYKGDWTEDSGNSSIDPHVKINIFNTQAPTKNGQRTTDHGKDGASYVIKNPKDSAFADIDAMINHDGPDYGHRHSLLTPWSDEMGVSVGYSKKTKNYYLIIDVLQDLPHNVTKLGSGKYTYDKSSGDNTGINKKATSQKALKAIYGYQRISNFYNTHNNVMINLK